MSAKLSYRPLLLVVIASCAVVASDDEESPAARAPAPVSVRLLREKTHHLVVEEVDPSGRGVVKELELPDYDSEERREDEKRRREQRRELGEAVRRDECRDGRDERGRRRCLQRWRRRLRVSYRMWRDAMRRAIKDVDDKIRNLSPEDESVS